MKVIEINYPQDEQYLIVSNDIIYKENVFETYDKYGFKVGHENAGDYSIYNQYSDLSDSVLDEIRKRMNLSEDDEIELNGDNSSELAILINGEENEEAEDIATEFEHENSNYEEVLAITYWDGHNWKTFTLDGENPDGNLLDDDDETAKAILKAYNDVEMEDWLPATEKGDKDGYVFTSSNWVGHFEIAEVWDKDKFFLD